MRLIVSKVSFRSETMLMIPVSLKINVKHQYILTGILGMIFSPFSMKRSGLILASYLLLFWFYTAAICSCIFISARLFILIIITSNRLMHPRIIPPKMAFLNATRAPALNASMPPVIAPATIWFAASCLLRRPIKVQSVIENNPAQSAKLPTFTKSDTSEDRCSFFEQHDSSVEFLLFWGVVPSSDKVHETSSNAAHGETASKILDNSIGAWKLSVCHLAWIIIIAIYFNIDTWKIIINHINLIGFEDWIIDRK